MARRQAAVELDKVVRFVLVDVIFGFHCQLERGEGNFSSGSCTGGLA